MRRILKWVGIFLAVIVLTVVALPFLINVNSFKPMLESELSRSLNREVKLGNLKLSLFAGEVQADDLMVSDDPAFAKPAFIHARSLRVGAELWPFLISRRLIVRYLAIDQPEIALMQSPSGDWNFSSLGAKAPQSVQNSGSAPAPPLDLSVKLVRVQDGRLTLGRTVGHWKPVILEHTDLELRDFSAASAFPFTISAKVAGGGTFQLDGKAGPIHPTDAAMTPLSATIKLTQLNLAGSGMNDFAPEMDGIVSIDAAANSDGRLVKINGKVTAQKLKLAKAGTPATRPVGLDFAVQHDVRKHAGALRQGDVHIGRAVAHLTGTYAEQGHSTVLNMKLSGPEMPVEELEALLPAMGVVLPAGSRLSSGTASMTVTMEGPADELVTAGSLALNNARLTGFDLPKKMATIEKLAGIKASPDTEIQTLSANIRVAPDGTVARDLQLIVPSIGDLTGEGTVSPAKQLDFHLRASVHTSGMLAAVNNTPIPITVQGTCADPVFRPDVKAVIAEKVKTLEDSAAKGARSLFKGLLEGKK